MATLDELLALLPDNTTGQISAADMREIVTVLFDQGVPTLLDVLRLSSQVAEAPAGPALFTFPPNAADLLAGGVEYNSSSGYDYSNIAGITALGTIVDLDVRGNKYFLVQVNDKVLMSLCITLPVNVGDVSYFETTEFSSFADPWTIAMRRSGGALKIGEPTADDEATTRAYVDGHILGKEPLGVSSMPSWTGVNTASIIGADADKWVMLTVPWYGATSGTGQLASYGPNGKLTVAGAPTSTTDAVNKQYADGLQPARATVPASATATGVKGQIAVDTNYLYVCTATNTWRRVAVATW